MQLRADPARGPPGSPCARISCTQSTDPGAWAPAAGCNSAATRHTRRYTRILDPEQRIQFPRSVSRRAASLVKQLCERDVTKRLGCGKRADRAVKGHRFFRGTPWKGLLDGSQKAPYAPEWSHDDAPVSPFQKYLSPSAVSTSSQPAGSAP